MQLNFRQRLLGTTLLVGAGLAAQPALGQTVPQRDGTPVSTANPTGPVEAQPLPATSAAGKPVEQPADIVVTGSRIPQPNLTSAAPVTVVTSQDIKLQGITKVEDLLNSLPSVFAAQSSTLSNGASGTAEVDLRGLGAKRTLVLINGRRLVPGDPGSASIADLNFIPSSLVKRVEVLTGGASSTYGADAVSGVVNFIMDTNFSGIRFDGQYSVFQHNNRNGITPPLLDARTKSGLVNYGYPKHSVVDGATFDGTVSVGANFNDNRGHAVAYFGYRKAKPVLQARRDYSACSIQERKPTGTNPNPLQCGGSAFAQPGNLVAFVPTPTTTADGAHGTAYTSTLFKFSGASLLPGSNRYNFAPLNYFQRPDERYTAGVFANYEVSPAIKPYLEFMFMDDRTLAQIAPSGNFGNTSTLNCDNPLLSAQQKGVICAPYNLVTGFNGTTPLVAGNTGGAPLTFFDPGTGAPYNIGFAQILRRNVEGGPRIDDRQHTSFRGVLGTRGDLNKAFSYDAYYQYGRTQLQTTYSNEFSARRLALAQDVVTDNRAGSPTFGQPVCRSVTSGADPSCVPYDIFTGAPVSAAAVNYLAAVGFQRGQTTEQVADVNITGRLGEYGLIAPWATDGVGINIGAEYRREGLELQTDQEFATGDLTGQGAPTLPIKGSFNVKEFFGEVSLPIVQHNFVEDLSLTAGYRRSGYSLSNGRKFSTDTYKLGLEFAPIRDLRFRGAYNRAVRAPNIQELFATNFVGLDGSNDPCAKKLTPADAGCLAQLVAVNPGSTPAQFVGKTIGANPAAQYNGQLGGNPNLVPEVSTTKTLGVVLQPRFIPRFALTVDYFDIKVKKAIQGYGADAILSACNAATTSATSPSPICSLIRRDASSGSLYLSSNGFVTDLPQNIGSLRTRGIEANASYSHQLGRIGSLSASLVGTYLDKYTTNNGLLPTYDCAGYYGTTCGSPAPRWRHKARLSLTLPDGIGLSAQWRYFGKVKVDLLNPSDATSGSSGVLGSHIASQSYFDLASTFTIGNHFNLRIGVNNILDRQPPLVTTGGNGNGSQCAGVFCNGNTYPGVYDSLGRYLYTGITLNF